ncbi:hypothetical protein EV360DRAFT_71071 [Lentinula raphanica]|nr:hypothetical protein EV360DRAFT_71071 [Lentinula raphanica]
MVHCAFSMWWSNIERLGTQCLFWLAKCEGVNGNHLINLLGIKALSTRLYEEEQGRVWKISGPSTFKLRNFCYSSYNFKLALVRFFRPIFNLRYGFAGKFLTNSFTFPLLVSNMLFVAVHSKLAGLCVLMATLRILASPVPAPPTTHGTHQNGATTHTVLIVTDAVNTVDAQEYLAFESSSWNVVFGIQLPGGILPSQITDPCVHGAPEILRLDSHSEGLRRTVLGTLTTTQPVLEGFIHEMVQITPRAFFEGGTHALYMTEVITELLERFSANFQVNHLGLARQIDEVKQSNRRMETLDKEKFWSKLTLMQRMRVILHLEAESDEKEDWSWDVVDPELDVVLYTHLYSSENAQRDSRQTREIRDWCTLQIELRWSEYLGLVRISPSLSSELAVSHGNDSVSHNLYLQCRFRFLQTQELLEMSTSAMTRLLYQTVTGHQKEHMWLRPDVKAKARPGWLENRVDADEDGANLNTFHSNPQQTSCPGDESRSWDITSGTICEDSASVAACAAGAKSIQLTIGDEHEHEHERRED